MEEISYINDYYQKIIEALDNNIHPKKIINLNIIKVLAKFPI